MEVKIEIKQRNDKFSLLMLENGVYKVVNNLKQGEVDVILKQVNNILKDHFNKK